MMLEGKVEAFESEIRVLATESPLDGSILARNPEDGACCSGRDEVISVGAFVNGIDVAVELSVFLYANVAYNATHK